MGEGTEDPLRRRRRVRPGLFGREEVTMPTPVRTSRITARSRSVLPGVRLTLGFTVAYLVVLVVLPLSTLFVRSARMGWGGFWDAATSPRAIAAYRLSIGSSVTAALVNGVFGLL